MKGLAVAVCLSLLASPARAWQSQPSLAEIAEKEKQRRAAAKAKGKTYTEADLGRSGRGTMSVSEGEPPSSPAPGEAGPAATGDAKPQKSDLEQKAERRAELQKKVEEQQKLRAAIQKAMDDAQRELNDLTNYTYGSRREALMKVIDDGTRELAKIGQAIADLEEQARREGISLSR